MFGIMDKYLVLWTNVWYSGLVFGSMLLVFGIMEEYLILWTSALYHGQATSIHYKLYLGKQNKFYRHILDSQDFSIKLLAYITILSIAWSKQWL